MLNNTVNSIVIFIFIIRTYHPFAKDITEYRKSYKIVLRITAIQKEEDDFAIKKGARYEFPKSLTWLHFHERKRLDQVYTSKYKKNLR